MERAARYEWVWTDADSAASVVVALLVAVAGIDQAVISKLENHSKEDTRMQTMVALARAFGVPTDELFVPAEPVPVEPTDPQIDVMMGLVEDMTPEERQSAEMFIRFVLAQRKKQSRRKTKG